MAGNDGMKSTFGRIGLRKFLGFGGQFGWRKKAINGSGLEKNEKNDQALLVDDGQKD